MTIGVLVGVSVLTVLPMTGCEYIRSLPERLTGPGSSGVNLDELTAMVVSIIEEREASEAERAEANAKADDKLKDLNDEEKTELKENETYVAVEVNKDESADTKEVMVYDPETGEPVNDTVYVVDNSDGSVDSGSKVDLGEYDAIYVD